MLKETTKKSNKIMNIFVYRKKSMGVGFVHDICRKHHAGFSIDMIFFQFCSTRQSSLEMHITLC